MRACGRFKRRWIRNVSMGHRGNGLYVAWIGSINGLLWDGNRPVGSLEGEDFYLLKTQHGVDEMPAYNAIQLLRLTNVNTLRVVGSESQKHSGTSLKTGILWLHLSENSKNLKVTGRSRRARRQTSVIFFSGWKMCLSCSGLSGFGSCLDGRWSLGLLVIFMFHILQILEYCLFRQNLPSLQWSPIQCCVSFAVLRPPHT